MILSVAMHQPKGAKEEAVFLASLKEYGDIHRKHAGHLFYGVGKDEKTGTLAVVSVWNSKEDVGAAMGDLLEFRKGFDFKTNQEGPTRYWSSEVEFAQIG